MTAQTTQRDPLSHKGILALAVPIMLSNLSTPLLGIVDTAVVGRLPGAQHVGAVAAGSLIFSFVFWAFGFLRMGTTGLTAQALGAKDDGEVQDSLLRALLVAATIGAVLFFLGPLVRWVSLAWLEGSAAVESLAGAYVEIRIRSAPATLANYALLGWFVGLGRTRIAFALQLTLNATNMALDALFVVAFQWGVEGVAWGSVIAEWFALAVGLFIAARHRHFVLDWQQHRVFNRARIRRTLVVNADIMVRSVALMFVFTFFMAQGAAMGNLLLAANAVLMHFVESAAFFLDGMAAAAESLVGRAIGARDSAGLRLAIRRTTLWGGVIGALGTLVFLATGTFFIDALTTDEATRETARLYRWWAAMAPVVGVWCFQFDGVFIGATQSAEMRNSMLASVGLFLAAYFALKPWGNHGLWAAFHIFYVARALTLLAYFPRFLRHHGAGTSNRVPSTS